jgi:hypothetical protein
METFILRQLINRWKGNPVITAFVHDQESSASATWREKEWNANELLDRNHVRSWQTRKVTGRWPKSRRLWGPRGSSCSASPRRTKRSCCVHCGHRGIFAASRPLFRGHDVTHPVAAERERFGRSPHSGDAGRVVRGARCGCHGAIDINARECDRVIPAIREAKLRLLRR